MAPWRLVVFVVAVLVLKGTLSSEEVKDVPVLGGHSSGSDSQEHTKSVSGRDESTTDADDLSLYSDEQDYTRSGREDSITDEDNLSVDSDEQHYIKTEAESIEDNQSQYEQHTETYKRKDYIIDEDDLSLDSEEQDYTKSEAGSTEDNQSQYEEHAETSEGKDSITDEDYLSLDSNEQNYINSKAESIEDDQSQLHKQTVTFRGEDSFKLKDISRNNKWSRSKQGEKRSRSHDDWYNKDLAEPHWYIRSGQYKDKGDIFKKITDTPNKFSKNYYYTWPVVLPYYLKSHKGFSTTKEEYLEGGAYNEQLLHDSKHMKNAAAVPVSKTGTYSVNNIFPVNSVDIRNVDQHPLLYRVQLHNDHHYQPLGNGPEDDLSQKRTTRSDGTLLEKDIYYNKPIRIGEPERVEYMKPWYGPFYHNNKRGAVECKQITPFVIAKDIYRTNGFLPQIYDNSGKYKCHCCKNVDEGGLFRYHNSYILNKHNANDALNNQPSSYQFLRELDKQHNDLTGKDKVTFYDMDDSTIKYHPHITYVSEEDKSADCIDKHDQKKIIQEVVLESDTLDDQIINVDHTGLDPNIAAIDSDMAEVNEEIIEEVAHKLVQEFHPHYTNNIEEDKFFSKTQNNDVEFVENDDLKVETLNDEVINLQEIDTTVLDEPKLDEEIIETIEHKTVHEELPHNKCTLEEDKVFGYTENHDHTDIVERVDFNIGTLDHNIIKLHEIDTTVKDVPTESEEIIEETVDSEVQYLPHDIYGSKEDSSTDCKGNGEYMEVTDREYVEYDTLNDPLRNEGNILVSKKPMIPEEIVEEAIDSTVKHYPQHIHDPEENNYFDYAKNHGFRFTEKGNLNINTLNDHLIKFHEEKAFASEKPMIYEETIKEVADTGPKYYPHYDYAIEKDNCFDYFRKDYHTEVIKSDHLISDTFNEQMIESHETENAPGIASIVLNKPMVYEEAAEEVVAANPPHNYHPYYIQGEEKKEIFHHNGNHDYSEVFKTDNWSSDSVSGQIIKFHEAELSPKSDHIVSHEYSTNEEVIDVPQAGNYLIPGSYQEKSGISLYKDTGDLKFDTEYDSRATHTAFLNKEYITDDTSQSETYEINGDIPYNRPFLLKEISEYDAVETLDEDSDEIYIDIGVPLLYKKEGSHVEMGHQPDKFVKTEDSTIVTDHIFEEADSVLLSEKISNEVKEENKILEDIVPALLLERTHSKKLIEDDVAMETDMEHDAIYSLKNGGIFELPTESTISDSSVVSTVQYERGDKLPMYNEETNYEVESSEHAYDEEISIQNPSPYESYEGYVWNNEPNKNYVQHITDDDCLQEKEFMPENIKYDIHDETESPFINEKNFKVTDYDYPAIKDVSVPFSEKDGSIINYLPKPDHNAAPKPCSAYRCRPFYSPMYYPYHSGDISHWPTTSGTKFLSELYTVPASSNSLITTAGVRKYPWQFQKVLTY